MMKKENIRIAYDGEKYWLEHKPKEFEETWLHLHGKMRGGHTVINQYFQSLGDALVAVSRATIPTVYFDADGYPIE